MEQVKNNRGREHCPLDTTTDPGWRLHSLHLQVRVYGSADTEKL